MCVCVCVYRLCVFASVCMHTHTHTHTHTQVMLFRHTTGEAWNGIMYYTAQSDPYLACQKAYGNYLSDGCAGGGLGLPPGLMGRLVHVFWTILATYMLMQLFTAVILENFAEQQLQDKAVLPRDKLNEFVDAWYNITRAHACKRASTHKHTHTHTHTHTGRC